VGKVRHFHTLEDGQRRGIKGAKKKVDPMNLGPTSFVTKSSEELDREG